MDFTVLELMVIRTLMWNANLAFSPELIGSNCTIKDTENAGVCRPFANCRRAKEVASKGVLPQKCAITDKESELVCCAEADYLRLQKGLVTQLPIGSKVVDYCIDLAENIYPCKETNTGWARGDMCALLTPDSNEEYYRQLPPRHRTTFDNVKFVGLGGSFTPQYTPDETYDITRKQVHPLYNSGYSIAYNNIALLLFDRRVTFTNRILPTCLHTRTPLPNSGFIFNTWEGSADRKVSFISLHDEQRLMM